MNEQIFNDDYLKEITDILSLENKKIFISGDLNFDLLNVSNHDETFSFFDTMMSNCLLPLITIHTQINSGTNTLIDNIFTNHLHPDMKTGNLSIKISDHLPSFVIVPSQNQNHLPKKHNLYSRKCKNFDVKILYLIILKLIGRIQLKSIKKMLTIHLLNSWKK